MSEKNWNDIYQELSKLLIPEAIQKTKKEETKKGYDTTGYGYQYIVNRFNEVLGNAWGYTYEVLKIIEGHFKSGTPYFDITVTTTIWCLSVDNGRTLVGGHISSAYADALKGAITNSFKKTAAMWGVGKEAYEGSLDDDAKYEEEIGDKNISKKPEMDNKKGQETGKADSGNATTTIPAPPEDQKKFLTFNELSDKMKTSKNVFELNNRCKKYRPDYDQLTNEQKVSIQIERDKRKVWLEKGEGDYTDIDTKGINKKE